MRGGKRPGAGRKPGSVSAAKTRLQHYIPTLARRFGPKTIGWARKITDLSTLVLPPGILLMLFLTTSFYGLNFGFHWDENRAKFDSVQNSVATGLFMQAAGKGGITTTVE